MNGTAVFIEMFSQWNTTVGRLLAGQDPSILIRIVELASTEEGISQGALQHDLKINQPRLSKLTKKLVASKWVEVRRPSSDRRFVLMRATDHARKIVKDLNAKLSFFVGVPTRTAPKKRGAPKVKVTPRQDSLF